jgi:hypothetical protein
VKEGYVLIMNVLFSNPLSGENGWERGVEQNSGIFVRRIREGMGWNVDLGRTDREDLYELLLYC